MTQPDISVAKPSEAGLVLGVLRAASTSRSASAEGIWGHDFPDVERDLPAGLVHLGRLGGEAVGTFVLRWADEAVWGPDDGDSGYLHRLATRPEVAGRGIGQKLITAAGDLVLGNGRHWLRLDCDRDNSKLRRYYESLGFTHAGDVTGLRRQTRPGYRSASRYQRRANPNARPVSG
jgi:GNAT superfamily N-acetyltransferase